MKRVEQYIAKAKSLARKQFPDCGNSREAVEVVLASWLQDQEKILEQLIDDATLDTRGFCAEQCLAEDCEECKIKDLIEAVRKAKKQYKQLTNE